MPLSHPLVPQLALEERTQMKDGIKLKDEELTSVQGDLDDVS